MPRNKDKKKRFRTANWSFRERQSLLNLIRQRKELLIQEIVTKGGQNNLRFEKNAAWDDILGHLKQTYGKRFEGITIKNLKVQWQNMKRVAKTSGLDLETEEDIPLAQIKKEKDEISMPLSQEIVVEDTSVMQAVSQNMHFLSQSVVNRSHERSLTPQRRIPLLETATQTSPKPPQLNPLNATLAEKQLKIHVLREQCNILKVVRETAGLNKIIAEERLKQILRMKQFENRMYAGEPGSGAGKGGGGGGSIREAGGSFGKMEAAREDEFFYKKQQEQLKNLKGHLSQEISFHEEQVKRHLEAIERHKAKAMELERAAK